MDNNTYEYTDQWGDKFDIAFFRSRYVDNGRPYVGALCDEGDGWEVYADVSVNIFAPLTAYGSYYVHADTNNVPHLVEWMCSMGFLTKTGLVGQSGWCEYPEVELNREWYDSLPSYEE